MEIVLKQAQDVATVSPQRVEDLVDRFIASQDVKLSSKLLYRRTLKQYFNWVDKKGYLLSEIARPQLLEYKDELLLSCLLYTSPSPRDRTRSRMPSSA